MRANVHQNTLYVLHLRLCTLFKIVCTRLGSTWHADNIRMISTSQSWLNRRFLYFLFCALRQGEVERMTSQSLNVVTADTVKGIIVYLLLVWYRWTLPRAPVAPDSISVSPHPLFPGTDILSEQAVVCVCHHCVDQVMSQSFHGSHSFTQRAFSDAEGWRQKFDVLGMIPLSADWRRQDEGWLDILAPRETRRAGERVTYWRQREDCL